MLEIKIIINHKNHKITKPFNYYVDGFVISYLDIVEVEFSSRVLLGYVVDINDITSINPKIKKIKRIVKSNYLNEMQKNIISELYKDNALPYIEVINKFIIEKRLFASNNKQESILVTSESPKDMNESQQQIYDIVKCKPLLKRYLINEEGISTGRINTMIKNGNLIENTKSYDYSYDKNIIVKLEETVADGITLDTLRSNGINILESTNRLPSKELMHSLIAKFNNIVILVEDIRYLKPHFEYYKEYTTVSYMNSSFSNEEFGYYQDQLATSQIVVADYQSITFIKKVDFIFVVDYNNMEYNLNSLYKQIVELHNKLYGTTVCYSSMSPTIEAYARCKHGNYNLIQSKELQKYEYYTVSIEERNLLFNMEVLIQISEHLKKFQKVVIYCANSSHSSYIQCTSCNHVYMCPKCKVSLNYSKSRNKLNCQYCNHSEYLNSNCSSCNAANKYYFGGVAIGKITEYLVKRFGEYSISTLQANMNFSEQKKVMKNFSNNKIDLMIVDDTVNKFYSVQKVSKLYILNIEKYAYANDVFIYEKFRSLLSNLHYIFNGVKVIQYKTVNPYIDKVINTTNYGDFYLGEMYNRRLLKQPPFYKICIITALDSDLFKVIDKLKTISDQIFELFDIKCELSKPFVDKIGDRFKRELIIKYKKEPLNIYLKNILTTSDVSISVKLNYTGTMQV